MRSVLWLGLLCAGLGLAACGGEEPAADTAYDDVRTAIAGGGGLGDYRGQTVRWTGTVADARRQFGDDYIEEGVLLVDMDGEAEDGAAPDLILTTPAAAVDDLEVGNPVTFVAVIRETQRHPGTGGTLLRMELKELVTE